MSIQPTYEELTASVNNMKKEMADYKTQLTTFSATTKTAEEEDNDKKEKSAFKKAMKEMDEHNKNATHDMDEVKDAFKRAADEDDPEKKKEAMKKAIEEKEDYMNKKSKKAESESAPKDDKEKDAKIASLEDKFKLPLMQKILTATKIMDESTLDSVQKELTAATLQEVEKRYATLAPYMAAVGLGDNSTSPVSNTATSGTMGFIPFQASAVTTTTSNVFEGSIETIDFTKVSTKDIEAIQ